MKCYRHQDRDAVGICKSCQKGLCIDCAAEVNPGLACKGECEKRAQELADIVARTVKDYPATVGVGQSVKGIGILHSTGIMVMGIMLIVVGVWFGFRFTAAFWFVALGGLITLVLGAQLVRRYLRVEEPRSTAGSNEPGI